MWLWRLFPFTALLLRSGPDNGESWSTIVQSQAACQNMDDFFFLPPENLQVEFGPLLWRVCPGIAEQVERTKPVLLREHGCPLHGLTAQKQSSSFVPVEGQKVSQHSELNLSRAVQQVWEHGQRQHQSLDKFPYCKLTMWFWKLNMEK